MGDYVRWAPPFYGDDSQQPLGTRSALYLSLNRGKRSLAARSQGARPRATRNYSRWSRKPTLSSRAFAPA